MFYFVRTNEEQKLTYSKEVPVSGRTRRGFVKKYQVLEKLAVGRQGAIQVRTEAKINSAEYRVAGDVLDTIDRLTGALTGDEAYFHLKMARSDTQSD